MTKRGFDSGDDVAECGRMGCIGERLQCGRAFSRRKIQFTRTTLSDIDGDDSGDFFSERLNCNWTIHLSALGHKFSQDCSAYMVEGRSHSQMLRLQSCWDSWELSESRYRRCIQHLTEPCYRVPF